MGFLIYLAKHLLNLALFFVCLIALGTGFGWLSDRIEYFGAYGMLTLFAICIVICAWQDYKVKDKRK